MSRWTDQQFVVAKDGVVLSKVVGVTFERGYQFAAELLIGHRTEGVLIADPTNEHDHFAVEVHVPLLEARIGFLPKLLAAAVSPILREDHFTYNCHVWAVQNLDRPDRPGLRTSFVFHEPALGVWLRAAQDLIANREAT